VPTSSSDAAAAAWVQITRECSGALKRRAARVQQFSHAKAEQCVIDSERRHTEATQALQKAMRSLFRD
jgi:hypothetical protein